MHIRQVFGLVNRRLVRWTGRVLAVGLLLWLAWGTYLRLTTPPALSLAELDALVRPAPVYKPNDASAEVLRVANELKRRSVQTPPDPPDGCAWQWRDGSAPLAPRPIDWHDVVAGPWSLVERPNLAMAVRVLKSADGQALLAALRGLRGRPLAVDTSFSKHRRGGLSLPECSLLARVLEADARRQHTAGDLRGAWEDYRTAMWLIEETPADQGPVVRSVFRNQHDLVCELALMAREEPLPVELLVEIQQELARLRPLSELTRTGLAGDRRLSHVLLDALYAKRARNGWLVVAQYSSVCNVWPQDQDLSQAQAQRWSAWWV